MIHQSFYDFPLLQLESLEFLGYLQHFTVAVTSQWHWNVIKTSVYKLALKSKPNMSIQKRKNNYAQDPSPYRIFKSFLPINHKRDKIICNNYLMYIYISSLQ